jgi:hypothetical protein
MPKKIKRLTLAPLLQPKKTTRMKNAKETLLSRIVATEFYSVKRVSTFSFNDFFLL